MNRLVYLQIALAVFTVALVVAWIRFRRPDPDDRKVPTPGQVAVGFVTNFFDTLGIGSFAPTTAMFRLFKMVPDERIPGTLNVGHTLPTILQAFLFTRAVAVEFETLVIMIIASILGAWLGAGIVAHWPRRKIQIGMGGALLVAATIFTLQNLNIVAGGGEALGLSGPRLIIGAVGNFALGALMTLGVGLYGPSLIMISLLGMNPRAAFPIMMGSCAFLMVVAATRFIRERAYREQPALGLTVGGIPAVLIAFYIVKSLELKTIRWLVVAVVLYTSVTMLRSAFRERQRQV